MKSFACGILCPKRTPASRCGKTFAFAMTIFLNLTLQCNWSACNVPPDAGMQKGANFSTLIVGLAGTGDRIRATWASSTTTLFAYLSNLFLGGMWHLIWRCNPSALSESRQKIGQAERKKNEFSPSKSEMKGDIYGKSVYFIPLHYTLTSFVEEINNIYCETEV
jgi:hypothetical protein